METLVCLKVYLRYKVQVTKNESFFNIKSTGNDVFGVFKCHVIGLFQSEVLPQVFLIISQLYDEWNIKSVL